MLGEIGIIGTSLTIMPIIYSIWHSINYSHKINQDVYQFLNSDEIQIALVLDATASMREVWGNLDTVVNDVLTTLTNGEFTNINGEEINLLSLGNLWL